MKKILLWGWQRQYDGSGDSDGARHKTTAMTEMTMAEMMILTEITIMEETIINRASFKVFISCNGVTKMIPAAVLEQ